MMLTMIREKKIYYGRQRGEAENGKWRAASEGLTGTSRAEQRLTKASGRRGSRQGLTIHGTLLTTGDVVRYQVETGQERTRQDKTRHNTTQHERATA